MSEKLKTGFNKNKVVYVRSCVTNEFGLIHRAFTLDTYGKPKKIVYIPVAKF